MGKVEEVRINRENPNDDKVTLIEWFISDGESVKAGQELVGVESAKVYYTISSSKDGVVKTLAEVGEVIPVGQVIAVVGESQEALDSTNVEAIAQYAQELDDSDWTHRALRFIRHQKLSEIEIEQILKNARAKNSDKKAKITFEQVESELMALRGIKVSKVSATKQTEIEKLRWSVIQTFASSVSRLVSIDLFNDDKQVLSSVIHASAHALTQHKSFNSYMDQNNVFEYQNIKIGFALSMNDQPLMVPVIDSPEKLSVEAIQDQINDLSLSYMRKELGFSQLSQPSFTITDISALGIDTFAPIINFKQSAILGVSSGPTPRQSRRLTLVYDHRIHEGVTAARFLDEICQSLTN